MSVTARLDWSAFQHRLAVLKRPEVPVVRALNRSIASGETLAVRAVSGDLGLKQTVIRPYIETSLASPSKLQATLYASAQRIRLEQFGARGRLPSRRIPGGVTVVMRSKTRHYAHAFRARMKSGHVGVFKREGRRRLKIFEMEGYSTLYSYAQVEDQVRARVLEQLAKNTEHEIRFALSR